MTKHRAFNSVLIHVTSTLHMLLPNQKQIRHFRGKCITPYSHDSLLVVQMKIFDI